MKQTYDHRVMDIQQEMIDRVRTTAELNRIDFALSFSRITVELTAAAIRDFAAIHGACTMGETEAYLKEQGLIPDGATEFDPQKEANTISISSHMFGEQEGLKDA